MKTPRKIYDRDFKEKVIKLSYERRNISQVEKEFEITRSLLTRWRQEFQKFGEASFQGSGNIRLSSEQKKIQNLEKRNKELEAKYTILKKGYKYLFQGKQKTYEFIQKNEKKYSISIICKALGIGDGRYYRWKKEEISETQLRVNQLKNEITIIFFNAKQRYGSIKITQELHSRGYKISSSQVSFYMRQMGLYSVKLRKYKVTTDSNHNHYVAPNILNREFTVKEPAKAWVSDITYIQTNKRRLYLTIILDLFDRKIIGWSLSNGLTTKQTIFPAWEMAIKNRKIRSQLIFHSDRGVQYANKSFTKILDSCKNVTRSMSRKGDHLDNAVAESFFRSLKTELIYRTKLLTKKEMRIEIYEFIENWYNKERRHSSLNYKTIEEFDKLHNII